MDLDHQFDTAELEPLGRYTFRVQRGDSAEPLKVMLAQGPRAREAAQRNRRSAALRELLPLGSRIAGLFPAVRAEGFCRIDGERVPCLITSFVGGEDLFALAERLRYSEIEWLASELGAALAELHRIDPALLEASAHVGPPADWGRHILGWCQRLVDDLGRASADVTIGGCSASAVIRLFPHILRTVEQCASALARLGPPATLHGDAHGGNFLATFLDGRWVLSGIIDERLRAGDGLFDLASLTNWSHEIWGEREHRSFSERLFDSYFATMPKSADQELRLRLYHLERSLGRLDFYMTMSPEARERVEPSSTRRLYRHLEMLEACVSGSPSLDGWRRRQA